MIRSSSGRFRKLLIMRNKHNAGIIGAGIGPALCFRKNGGNHEEKEISVCSCFCIAGLSCLYNFYCCTGILLHLLQFYIMGRDRDTKDERYTVLYKNVCHEGLLEGTVQYDKAGGSFRIYPDSHSDDPVVPVVAKNKGI